MSSWAARSPPRARLRMTVTGSPLILRSILGCDGGASYMAARRRHTVLLAADHPRYSAATSVVGATGGVAEKLTIRAIRSPRISTRASCLWDGAPPAPGASNWTNTTEELVGKIQTFEVRAARPVMAAQPAGALLPSTVR